jgi:methionyl-tRNA formyltransferase
LPVFTPEHLKSAEIEAQLASHDADLFVVVAYGLLLPATILAIPRFGCLNGHASLLPRWRGAAPIQRADPSRRQRNRHFGNDHGNRA